MRIGIGIDTGGTYTDAVAYDFARRKILGCAKAPTTRNDLAIGILEALDGLPAGLARQAGIVSLSTTLATNACVENRHGRAMLAFFGGDRRIINRHGAEYGLPPTDEMLVLDSHTTFDGKLNGNVDWELFRREMERRLPDLDGVGVVEVYAMRNGAVIEKEAKRLLLGMTDIPVVCGHELFSDLNGLQRGAGALLNAGLFPIVKDFIAAIKRAMRQRGIEAPVVIVRSDGSLMGEEFASRHPVETLLCGPAASVIGGVELSGEADAVVVDMGGTTTDIAVVRDGAPVRARDGIGLGMWKTFVKGLAINSVGLGGDSAIHHRDHDIILENGRVVPLCMAASAHPAMVEQLREEFRKFPRHTRDLHEFFALSRDISGQGRHSDAEKRFCDALAGGPLILRRAAAAVGRDEYTLDVSRLVSEGVVQVCGLTPTDVMHIKGDFTRHDPEPSRLAAGFLAANLGLETDAFCDRVYDEVKKKLYLNIVLTLLAMERGKENPAEIDAGVRALILESHGERGRNGRGFLVPSFRTDLALIGIGAPIHIFLPDVAERLGTRAVVPEHSGVANALGAITGKVHVSREILVRPAMRLDGVSGYEVLGAEGIRGYLKREEAEAAAATEAETAARAEAAERGAVGEITVTSAVTAQEAPLEDGSVYLGSKAVAHALGSPQL